MLWLALHLPLLSLESFSATLTEPARPLALMAGHRVHSVNTAAAECGVRPGCKRATALALAPQLLLAQADAARDAAALQAVAHAALAFTPAVTLQDTQTVLLEVQASLRLFGGLPALHQRLLASLVPLGHRVQGAAAPTALGAAWLAQWHPVHRGPLVLGPHATQPAALQALLDEAPVGLLMATPAALGPEHGAALQGMGLQTLSDLRQLPRAGLARRFGAGLLEALDRAAGQRPDPRCWLTLPARFESRLELYAQAETTEQVLHGASVLLGRLVAWAQARHARVAAFTLHMRHERVRQATLPPTELHVALAEPALDAAHLQLLLRERLARIELAAPTLELHLRCSQLVAGPAPHGELFPTRASEAEGLTRLLERLRARLGDDQVQRLLPVADHRPERASCSVPAHQPLPALPPQARLETLLPLHRPAWLLPEPLALAECDTGPLLQGRPLQLVSGPERIEAGWWDGAPAVRDYFIAQAEDGSLVWLYRARLSAPAGVPADATWYLQGRFG
jgi:protein ImuB